MTLFALEQWRREAWQPEVQADRCRASAALFDFSFMFVVRLSGPDAASVISRYVRRDISQMPPGSIRYCLHSDPAGQVLSDLTVWRLNDRTFDVMSGERQDAKNLLEQANRETTVENLSESTAIFSVQGPMSLAQVLPACEDDRLKDLGYFCFDEFDIHGVSARIGRLGYTGERGFEIVVDAAYAKSLWASLSGHIEVANFAVADILRIEAGFALFCNEFTIGATVEELAMDCFVDDAGDSSAASTSLVCFTATANERPVLWQRPQDAASALEPGELLATSACFSPLAGSVLGLGYVATQEKDAASPLIDPLGYFDDIRLRQRPFFDPTKRVVLGGWDQHFHPLSAT
jgi:glycine cleavage system aminomethyltransferase T